MAKELSDHVLAHDITSTFMFLLLMEILCHISWRPYVISHGGHVLILFHVLGIY